MALNLAKDKAREALIKLSATLKAKFMSLAESPESALLETTFLLPLVLCVFLLTYQSC